MEKTLFYHGKTMDGNRFTIAGKISPYGDLILGISLCSLEDQFVKSVGRAKAEGRINAKNGSRGKHITSFYSHDFYGDRETREDWFVGEESQAFIERVEVYDIMHTKELMENFYLYH